MQLNLALAILFIVLMLDPGCLLRASAETAIEKSSPSADNKDVIAVDDGSNLNDLDPPDASSTTTTMYYTTTVSEWLYRWHTHTRWVDLTTITTTTRDVEMETVNGTKASSHKHHRKRRFRHSQAPLVGDMDNSDVNSMGSDSSVVNVSSNDSNNNDEDNNSNDYDGTDWDHVDGNSESSTDAWSDVSQMGGSVSGDEDLSGDTA